MNWAFAIGWTIIGVWGFGYSIVVDLKHRPLRRNHKVHALFVAAAGFLTIASIWWYEVLT